MTIPSQSPSAIIAEARALLAAATPLEAWRASWDSQPLEHDGYPWSLFAIGPIHGSPADPTTPRYQEANRVRLADAALIAAAPRLIHDLADALAASEAERAKERATASAAIEAASIGEWVLAAVHGEPVSDFAESFGPVREAQALYESRERHSRLRAEAQAERDHLRRALLCERVDAGALDIHGGKR